MLSNYSVLLSFDRNLAQILWRNEKYLIKEGILYTPASPEMSWIRLKGTSPAQTFLKNKHYF